jgi:hypothetical protein
MRTPLLSLLVFAAMILPSLNATASGTPRPYFQQEVNYTIAVALDDVSHMLRGFESFEYINRSPDTLTFICMHLWPNAYKNRSTALARQLARDGRYVLFMNLRDDKGFIDSLDFRVNGVQVSWAADPEHIDIARIDLPEPLLPGGRITVSTPFRVKIPSGSISRLGHIGQSYQITQWYPKPAVYDRDGWHPMPYLTQGEFYSEFGSFDVEITLPANYVVGATGELQTDTEHAFLDSLAALETHRPDIPLSGEFPASAPGLKTIRYTQDRIHDFGWFADKRWMVLKGEVTTPHSGQKVTTWSMFTPGEMDLWKRAPEYLHDAVYYYSLWIGDYPYSQVTAVDGTISAGGGMEYPMVTVIGNSGSARSLETVIMHEVGHNWFYGILGSNERINAWMDEGLNSFFEERYMETKYPSATLADAIGAGKAGDRLGLSDFSQRYLPDLMYRFNASRGLDQPLQCHSDEFTSLNYGAMVYKKTALLFNYLRAWMGTEQFDRCMQAYYGEWQFKHPSPEDLRLSFELCSGQDLEWFFGDLIRTNRKIDFAIRSCRRLPDGSYEIGVKNTGETTGPALVALTEKASGRVLVQDRTDVLRPGMSQRIVLAGTNGGARWAAIDPALDIPQINRSNDRMRTSGLLRKTEPLQLSLFTGIPSPERTRVYWLPLVAWNEYDHWMPGIALHNRMLTREKLEWSVSPLYSVTNRRINGFAEIAAHRGLFTAGIRGQRFSVAATSNERGELDTRYALAEPFMRYSLRPSSRSSSGSLSADFQASWQLLLHTARITPYGEDRTDVVRRDQEAFRLKAQLSYRPNPFSEWKLDLRQALASDLVRQGSAEGFDFGSVFSGNVEYAYRYHLRRKKDIRFRAFYGNAAGGSAANYVFGASGVTGPADVFYDALYLGRAEQSGITSRQMVNGMGMLRAYIPAYFSEMVAFSGEVELPVRIPLLLSLNAVAPAIADFSDSDRVLASAVISVPVVREMLEIHFPVLVSSRLERFYDAQGYKYPERIMFTLNLAEMSPFSLMRKIKP